MAPIEVRFQKNINNLTLVLEADPAPRREYLLVTSLAGLFVLGLIFYGYQHYRWIQYGYQIEAAQRQKARLIETGRELQARRAVLRDLQRIDSIARNQLGMVAPAPGQTVIFSADAPLTIPVPSEDTNTQLAAKSR